MIRDADFLKSEDGRPPKKWWDTCYKKAQKFATDPAKFCGALWFKSGEYTDMSAAEWEHRRDAIGEKTSSIMREFDIKEGTITIRKKRSI